MRLPPLHQRGNKDSAQASARLALVVMACVMGTPYVLVCVQRACFSIGASSKAEAAVVFVSD